MAIGILEVEVALALIGIEKVVVVVVVLVCFQAGATQVPVAGFHNAGNRNRRLLAPREL